MRIEDFSLKLVPSSPGVYLMKDMQGQVLYIGKAKNLKARLASYFHEKGDSRKRIPFLMKKTKIIETIVVSNETEALLLENNLIKQYHPKYNVLLKDDKTFFCLAIALTHSWPKVEAIRTKGITSSKQQLIFGPYVSAEACHTLLEVISQWFPLRTCSDREFILRKRPCILYDMKRCLAPCVGRCSSEEYQTVLEKAILFLKGKIKEVVQDLEQAVQKASENLEFEQAAIHYRTLSLIKHAMAKQHVEKFHFQNIDVLGLYRNEELTILTILTVRSGKLLGARHFSFLKNAQEDQDLLSSFILQFYANQPYLPKEILTPVRLEFSSLPSLLSLASPPRLCSPKMGYGKELLDLAHRNAKAFSGTKILTSNLPYQELQKVLQTSQYPYRIECYDNAHMQGSYATGAYIVFENNQFEPKHYRTFSIHSSETKNDLALLEEVLTRRLESLTSVLPDMIMIDGGKTHYNKAKKILLKLNLTGIQVIAIAKEGSSHSRSLNKEKIFCETFPNGLSLPPTSKLLQFFQILRDEAHRFVIGQHRKKRRKALFVQEKIPGIGEVKRKRLLQKFKSWKQVERASQEELEAIPGLTKKDITTLLGLQKDLKKLD
ncbi:Excinuclease ABC subunit C,excinuclease ABC subunit C,Nuclease subunit of the excinuclease complex,excinuclease ABC subunit C,UvrC Helix-hairpin-helix N-terminal [Chlamydia serpentis]|uniref:UvrABC system protein C n=1 Tax=Chlamydia serpentis TaxID=1967782 RepID=A0A2R8FCC7_9CHLA|nr:excinuclease ABC subunit UvrC [Chlamydia serpentis]SPN74048.1 Excinuclease ABC subunit C,excinuclease ABC subunit C,Nuclease subunit of the excinuclease complex,excinuclease ABC subunit C,UvrC Helix-hairpin-helix N-terminal [Chlamydia serpentis]